MALRDSNHKRLNDELQWASVDWKVVNTNVVTLRKRVFVASRGKETKKVRQLQRLLLLSHSNYLYSIRKVTYGPGSLTPGIDDTIYNTPELRLALFKDLTLSNIRKHQPLPVRRVFIPKPGTEELRPLGVPSVKDRVIQMIYKNALEPEWEAIFEKGSYGFRPKRSVDDAINRIYLLLNSRTSRTWVLDADIAKCFDKISHEYLIQKLQTFPGKDLIIKWLKAGISLDSKWFSVEEGTPQGGVISPLLCNICLHGLEEELGMVYTSQGFVKQGSVVIIRYADDFIVLGYSKQEMIEIRNKLDLALSTRGLELSGKKTRICHICDGFDFLGFNIKVRPKRTSAFNKCIAKTADGYDYDYDNTGIYIHPSEKSLRSFKSKIKEIFVNCRGKNARLLIETLNPVIRGFAESKRAWHFNSSMRYLDNYIFNLCWRWCHRQHPSKSNAWKKDRYFKHLVLGPINNKWVFHSPSSSLFLYQFKWFRIQRHVMTKMAAAPDDPNS